MERQPPQHGPPLRPELDDDPSAILPVAAPAHHSPSRQAIDQLHHAVVPDLQTLRQDTYGDRLAALEPLELQEQLVLLRLHPGRAGGDLTQTQELADPIPELGERGVVDGILSPGATCSTHAMTIS
jgi:hypothetical protein